MLPIPGDSAHDDKEAVDEAALVGADRPRLDESGQVALQLLEFRLGTSTSGEGSGQSIRVGG